MAPLHPSVSRGGEEQSGQAEAKQQLMLQIYGAQDPCEAPALTGV